ncbi:YbaB/EbfC family nucleoid-associated protein [Rhabdothermincola salaria]|uniref:YbaB/EbfC family nucleoid-associated protein n=1 Tax=Rhabdothermincola salaria TaxID=2903142 RepID=UPI001E4806C1|nr:YbaB/EbfC family nucleoid-associated protein [Rhabdothermincola salaria]
MNDSLDLNAILGQAMEMQQQLLEAQAAAADAEVTGHAGGGAVTVTVTGGLEFRSVSIRPDAVDPDDVEMLEDLVLAALQDAMGQVGEMQQSSLGGLDMGALGGLGGLGGTAGAGGPADLDMGALLGGVIETDATDADGDDDDHTTGGEGSTGS